MTREVNTLRTNIKKDAQGNIKVEMEVVVTTQLLTELKALGCEIISSSLQNLCNNTRVKFPRWLQSINDILQNVEATKQMIFKQSKILASS